LDPQRFGEETQLPPEDYFSVSRSQRITKPPLTVSFGRDIRVKGGEKDSYAEIVKCSVMAEGGRLPGVEELQQTVNDKNLLSAMELAGEDDEEIAVFREEETS
jgi:hypothetical protein